MRAFKCREAPNVKREIAMFYRQQALGGADPSRRPRRPAFAMKPENSNFPRGPKGALFTETKDSPHHRENLRRRLTRCR